MIKLRQILVRNEGNQGIRSQAMLPPSVYSMELCHNAPLRLWGLYGPFLLQPGERVLRP